MKKLITCLLQLFFYALIMAQSSDIGEKSLIAIINGNIIDVKKGIIKERQNLLIENGKITAIYTDNKEEIPEGAAIIDATGKYIIPGLVDAHIHFFQSGGLYTRPDAIDFRKYRPYPEEIQWAKEEVGNILRRYLSAGITTVVDVGGPMYNFTIRREYSFGDKAKVAPSIYLTGPLVSTYEPEELAATDRPIIKVNNEEEAAALVQLQAIEKPDFIKIWYIAQTRKEAMDNYPIVEATVKEARMHNLRIVVHATQLYAAKLAVKVGADLLVHSVGNVAIDDEFIDLLKKQGTVYCPTLEVSKNYGKVFTQRFNITAEDYHYSPPTPLGSLMDLRHLPETALKNRMAELENMFDIQDEKQSAVMSKNLMTLLAADIPIATGTDAGNIGTLHVSSYFKELQAMQKAGMSNMQILTASTINGAKAVGKEAEFGTIEIGKRADILVLDKNPVEDLANLQAMTTLINKGNIIDLETIIQNSPEDLAQQQLNAYNGHNLEAFLAPYAEDVKIYEFPNKLLYEGKEIMRKNYQFIEQNPYLHCELVNRIVEGNTVIDQELVTVSADRTIKAIAIYKIKEGKIAEVYFIQ